MEESNALGTTIQDLSEKVVLRSKHMIKLKLDSEKFTQEAISLEIELTDMLEHHKKVIEELNRQILDLQKMTNDTETEKAPSVPRQLFV
ncbi:hypothetical protein JTB14_036754 [Gonioctena quinquepunctata]|nr:hypothetical protein JTB14_036754 [Gonioctena quinquepunctata]